MARVEDSPWAIPVAQIASRAGQSKPIDADFPAPSGIGDSIVGIKEGEPVHVSGQFDSIVDGLIFTGRLVAPFVSECTRCLKPIDEDWPVDVTVFFPYESGQDKANGKGGKSKQDDEIDIIAGEDESEDTYPLLENGAFADIEAMIRDTLVESLPLQPLCRPDMKDTNKQKQVIEIAKIDKILYYACDFFYTKDIGNQVGRPISKVTMNMYKKDKNGKRKLTKKAQSVDGASFVDDSYYTFETG